MMNVETAPPATTNHWRPRAHFTPRRNWINDPNGLVFYEGEYHLFYQYNPQGKEWGHMSWGHAVSRDLVQWTELPVAMPEKDYMIFSGCAVVDWNNSSGLGKDGKPPLVALYTAYRPDVGRQVQHLASSDDGGRSWQDYPGNPIIDRDMADFRDPKVFWHDATKAWIMVVALAKDHKVAIYRSLDLLQWDLASEFGPAGHTGGQWECPDLLELPVEGEDRLVWVLKVDVDKNVIGSVNGAQAFFGAFDGHRFVRDSGREVLIDHGQDFYAAQSWSDLPAAQREPIWIAWLSNHQSGHAYPTHPWRGTMTIPRKVTAKRRGDDWLVVQRPVGQWESLIENDAFRPVALECGPTLICPKLESLTGELRFTCGREARLVLELGGDGRPDIRIEFDGASKSITVERHATTWDAPDAYGEPMRAAWLGDAADIRILFDRQLVEIFIPSEGVTMSLCVFAPIDAALRAMAHEYVGLTVAGLE